MEKELRQTELEEIEKGALNSIKTILEAPYEMEQKLELVKKIYDMYSQKKREEINLIASQVYRLD